MSFCFLFGWPAVLFWVLVVFSRPFEMKDFLIPSKVLPRLALAAREIIALFSSRHCKPSKHWTVTAAAVSPKMSSNWLPLEVVCTGRGGVGHVQSMDSSINEVVAHTE